MIKYSVVLADDHQFFLDGIAGVLKDMTHLEIMSTAQNGYDLMDAVEKYSPNLVVLDLNMPGYDGMQCLQKIKLHHANTKVLVLTNYSQPELIEAVKKMDVDGFIIKNSSASELKDAINNILSGEKYFQLNSPSLLNDDSYFFDAFLKKYQLTKREVGIIRLICDEMSTKQIAGNLFLSELTINTHRKNIFRKLEVKNVAGLMNFARNNQLV